MRIFGFGRDRLAKLTGSSGFILEYREVPFPAVRLLHHAPLQSDPDDRSIEAGFPEPPCMQEDVVADYCPLETFLERVQKFVIDDWEAACQMEKRSNFVCKLPRMLEDEPSRDDHLFSP